MGPYQDVLTLKEFVPGVQLTQKLQPFWCIDQRLGGLKMDFKATRHFYNQAPLRKKKMSKISSNILRDRITI